MEAKLTQGPVNKTLFHLTLPLVWGIFSIIAFNVADTFFVGQLGTKQLAAMSFTFPVVTLFSSLAMGLGIGVSSVVAREIGQGQKAKVRRVITDSLSLGVIAVGIFILIGVQTIDPLFRALGANDTLIPLIREYMEIWYYGMGFLIIPMIGNFAIRATGDTRSPGMIMAFAAVVNLILDPFMIFGLWGFPRLELEGAAWATVISRGLTLIAALWIMGVRDKMLVNPFIKAKKIIRSWKEILYVGIPASGTSMIVPFSAGVITNLVSEHGPEAVAGFGVATRIESLVIIPLLALSASIGPFVGQNWGAKRIDRVQEGLKFAFLICLSWSLFVTLGLFYFAEPLTRAFDSEPLVIQSSVMYLRIVPISFGMMGILFIANASFNSLRKPLVSSVLSIVRVFVIYIPMAIFLSRFMGLKGIYFSAVLSNLVAGSLAYWITRKLYLTR